MVAPKSPSYAAANKPSLLGSHSGVAQLGRALDLGSRGHKFDSCHPGSTHARSQIHRRKRRIGPTKLRQPGVEVDVDRFVQLDSKRKTMQAEVDDLNRQAKQVSKVVGKAKDGVEREALKDEGRLLRAKILEVGSQLRRTR